jgi:hypothetical protein
VKILKCQVTSRLEISIDFGPFVPFSPGFGGCFGAVALEVQIYMRKALQEILEASTNFLFFLTTSFMEKFGWSSLNP